MIRYTHRVIYGSISSSNDIDQACSLALLTEPYHLLTLSDDDTSILLFLIIPIVKQILFWIYFLSNWWNPPFKGDFLSIQLQCTQWSDTAGDPIYTTYTYRWDGDQYGSYLVFKWLNMCFTASFSWLILNQKMGLVKMIPIKPQNLE